MYEAIRDDASRMPVDVSNPRQYLETYRTQEDDTMWVRKCDLDAQAEAPSPIPTRIASNEEFIPPPQSAEQARFEARQ